ncbi:MAG: hypothetical protein R2754_04760 [Microthrixaceae bacterium]
MTVNVVTTWIYLVIAVVLIVMVVPQWQRAGQEYLEEIFADDDRAHAVNRMLVTGLSLITMSLALFISGIGSPSDPAGMVRALVLRIATLLLLLGVVYAVNLGAYYLLAQRISKERAEDAEAGVPQP